jgi:signal transduction histidine kinase
VLRHGGPVAQLTISRSEDALQVEIRDEGLPRGSVPPDPPDPGHGLTGIRERAALFGGTSQAGPEPDGGFRLWVELPIGQAVESR